ncbi:CLUMA_CG020926, isoform A [Clunio marinus]|uniref:CLUMA_CG020926, isoform A n=1 Tax=Clunio marinus TaxID=568069 RepID=A0A1J1J775_9DIPT|nr:CLUMA_CG020926, isoform A [Clunio marinus]
MAIAKKSLKIKGRQLIFKSALELTWKQFTSTTSIHGLKNTSDSRGTIKTRITWATITIICFICAIILMKTFLMRYKSNPTRINLKTSFGQINEIEFPAVTFCNPNFMTLSRIKVLQDSLEIPSSLEDLSDSDIFRFIKYTAGFTNFITDFNESELPQLQELMQQNRYDVALTMKKLMYPCSTLLYRCRWEGKFIDCEKLFSISETYQGFCCSFNILKTSIISPMTQKKHYRIRNTEFFGPDMGLSVVLNPQIEKYAMTSINSEGMEILINHPNLFPSRSAIRRMLPHKQETFVEVRPERTDCSQAVRTLAISDRGCVFDNEHELRFFPTYKEENCYVECFMQLHIDTCGCLPYFYYNTENVPI